MKSTQFYFRIFAMSALLACAVAHASTVTGTVTNKTTGKPAMGDSVVLVDVQAGMGEVAHATTDAKGHYSLVEPGNSPYLVRVTHQGAGYFVAAPQGAAPADITVYDVAAKVQGVSIEADVLEVETESGQLKVTERFFVHNTSSPPTTQWSAKSFQVVLPADAVIDGVGGQRPNGLPTSIKVDPDGPKGHYAFNFPIQPDDGEKDTLFQLSYHLPYSDEKYAFHAQVTLPADNFAVLLPKSMTFTATSGDAFKSVPEDPNVQTFVLKNATPGKVVDFTIAGTGSIPREQQGTPGGQQPAGMGGQDASGSGASTAGPSSTPGAVLANPLERRIRSRSTSGGFWAGSACCSRPPRPSCCASRLGAQVAGAVPAIDTSAVAAAYPAFASPAAKNSQLLNVLKEELFALESDKINGSIEAEEYAKVKAALETVLKRALNKK